MEETILQNIMMNDRFFSKAYNHLDKDLFQSPENATIFDTIKTYVNEFSTKPNMKEIALTIKESNKINSTLKKATIDKFKEIATEAKIDNTDFLLSKTETWVQKQKLTKSIFEAADIIQADGAFEPIIGMVTDSLQVSFDTEVGLEFNTASDKRIEYYKNKNISTPIGIRTVDEALGGGIRPSSLFLFIGPTHSGKTAAKVFTTCSLLLKKENVLFVTLEMTELEIAKRVDANLLGTTINELETLPSDELKKRMGSIVPLIGNLVIKEFGAGTFNALHLKSLLDELKTKNNFIPDAIVVDYLGLMVSHRASIQSNSYDMLGKVAEDLHAIGKETYDSKGNKGVKMITSSQANRSAIGNVDAGMENISESLKIAMTADVSIFLLKTDSMAEQNQQLWKIVKNRYTGDMRSILVETDFSRMTYSEFNNSEVSSIDNIPSAESLDTGLDLGSFNF